METGGKAIQCTFPAHMNKAWFEHLMAALHQAHGSCRGAASSTHNASKGQQLYQCLQWQALACKLLQCHELDCIGQLRLAVHVPVHWHRKDSRYSKFLYESVVTQHF